MALTLREALRSFCSGGSKNWIYAVFWKLRPLDRMILTWEDGYYDNSKQAGLSTLSGISAPYRVLNGLDDLGHSYIYASSEDRDRSFMEEMLTEVHLLGEGVIGNVAYSGKHQWILWESMLGCSNNEHPKSWRNQFACGIKTIAVVAAAPCGVIQLGSKQSIRENPEFVRDVKTLFGNLQRMGGTLSVDTGFNSLSRDRFGTQTTTDISSRAELLSLIGAHPKNQILRSYDQGGSSTALAGSKESFLAEDSLLSNTGISVNQVMPMENTSLQPSNLLTCTPKVFPGNSRTTSSARLPMPSSDAQQEKRGGIGISGVASLLLGEESLGMQLLQRQQTKGPSRLQGQEQGILNEQAGVQSKCQDTTASLQQIVQGNNEAMQCVSRFLNNNEGLLGGVFDTKPLSGYSESRQSQNPQTSVLQNRLDMSRQLLGNNSSLESKDVEGSFGNVIGAHKGQVFASVGLEVPATSLRQSSQIIWQEMTGIKLETPMETACTNNNFMASQGGDLLIPAVHQETSKDTPSIYQDNFLDIVCSFKDPSKTLGTDGVDVLPIVDEYDPNGPVEFEKYLKSLMKGQDNHITSQSLCMAEAAADNHKSACRSTQGFGDWEDMLLQTGNQCTEYSASTFGTSLSTVSTVPATDRNFQGSFVSEKKPELLLDAVIANLHSSMPQKPVNELSSTITGSVLNCVPSEYNSSINTDYSMLGSQQKNFTSSQCINNTLKTSLQHGSTVPQFEGERIVKRLLQEGSSNLFGSWVEDSHSKCDSHGTVQGKKPEEAPKTTRKRAKPGESTRPRPKDRQQIQDRVKELREIVPNGTKCSIDALLERTIKHMLFLQSVTKHAEKLKQSNEPKGIDKDGSSITKNSIGSGASWALEVGGQTMECPIIVENMSQPRQLLVEMLCDERGLFLEIADIIRRLGLTILKGVMEAREDKIWARFVVEANRDVHRVEILWSLMQLLQQNTKSNSSQTSHPSVVTQLAKDSGSQTFATFQNNPVPIAVSMAEMMH